MAKKKQDIAKGTLHVFKDNVVDILKGRHHQQIVAFDIEPDEFVQGVLFVGGVRVGQMAWVASAKPGCKAQARLRMHVTDGAAAGAVPEPEDESATALAEEA